MVHQDVVLVAAICSTVILFGIISIIVYVKTENKISEIILLSIGFLSGIFLAEFITRKYGLEKFFANLY
jgi:energy-converting hydrogenase Eha subunit C